jgi:hypothetical protein
MNTDGGSLGGGEILQYMTGEGYSAEYSRMDNGLITQFQMLGWVKLLIIALIILIAVWALLKIINVKPFKGKGIINELDHMNEVRKRDAAILKKNKYIQDLTSIIEKSPFKMDRTKVPYMNYNLERADIRIPGGRRVIKAEEFNAVIKTIQILITLMGILLLLVNYMLGIVVIIFSVIICGTIPMMYIRGLVKTKDEEIEENFSDFYLMIHYVLMARANTPLSGIMKSYDKTTNSAEMHKFVDVCVSCIETYGEYEGPVRIAERYKEIPVVQKLMRLIRQANEGADIASELRGFREEILEAKKYAMERRGEKIIARAKASFNLLMPILVQAVISATLIYAEDLSIAGTFL